MHVYIYIIYISHLKLHFYQEIEARIVNSYWTRANFLIFTKLSTLWTIEAYSVRMEPISFYPHSTLLFQQSFPFWYLNNPLPLFLPRLCLFPRKEGKGSGGILWGLNLRKRGQYYEAKGGFVVLRGTVTVWCVPPLSIRILHISYTLYKSSGLIILFWPLRKGFSMTTFQ